MRKEKLRIAANIGCELEAVRTQIRAPEFKIKAPGSRFCSPHFDAVSELKK
jgi:hypothetical protein